MRGQNGPGGHYRSRRPHQSAANRRRNGPSPNRTASYSHIQVVAHPDANSNIRQEPLSPFVQKRSLQDELFNAGEYGRNTPAIASYPGFTPFSFAQVAATMSGNSKSTGGNSHDKTNDGEVEVPSTISQEPLSSVGTFRYTLKASKKKSKKWSPFDLGGLEGEFDADNTAIPKADGSVPEPPTSDQGTSHTSTAESRYANQLQGFSPTQSIICRERRDSFFDVCNTPTGTTFNAEFPQLRSTPAKLTHERSIIHKEDPEDTKLRLEHIMARIDDIFDVEEWDPDLPAGNSNNSPEQLIVEPQRITYTTVGSVAKADALPTFTPPVRIQREGAGRRLPILPPLSRGSDNYYNRSQQPGANTSPNYGSVASTQKNHKYTPLQHIPLSPLNLVELEKFNMTNLEKETLLETINSATSSAHIASTPTKQQIPQPTSVPEAPLNSPTSGNFSIQKMLQEETSGPSAYLTGSSTFAGLNKMQTLQRLAQFDNPAQVFAKGRLAEFKAAKMKQQMPDMAALGANNALQAQSFEHNKGGLVQFAGTVSDLYKNSSQRQGYQCPGQENDNPLQVNYDSTRDYPLRGYDSKGQFAPPGYPQPLTAGPPRQGQNSIAVNGLAWTSGYSQNTNNLQLFHSPQIEKQPTPWTNTFRGLHQQAHNTFSSVVTDHNQVRDTLSLAEMTKYFPGGFGPAFHMGGEYRSLDDDTKQSNMGLTDDPLKAKQQRKVDKLDRWFYNGLSRFDMTTTDHIEELENRDQGIILPIQYPNLAGREILSVNQVEDLTESECATPLINNLFGTLMAYSDNIMLPTNRRVLSKFVLSPAWTLDASEEGKKSIFGDDWVAPPKRLARDPRYHRSSLGGLWRTDAQHCY